MWPFSRRQASGGWIAFEDLLRPAMTASGVRVTQANAIEHPAVYRCVDLNANTIGSFPVNCLVQRGENHFPYPEPYWKRSPNDYQDFNGLVAEVVASCDMYDSAFLLKAVAPGGQLVGLSVLDPNAVTQRWMNIDGRPVVVYDVVLSWGGAQTKMLRLAYNEILHIKAGLPVPGSLRGVSPTAACGETIGTGLAARRFGSNFFGTGAHMSGIVVYPKEAGKIDEKAAERVVESMKKKHGGIDKSHAVGVLTGGAQWVPISYNPDDSQMNPTIKMTDVQIAAMFGVPAEYVTDVEGAKGYVTGLYQRQMMWYQTGLYSRITRLERAFSSLLPRPAYIKLDVDAWLRMDPEQRVAYYNAGQAGEWLSIEEIRGMEGRNPEPHGRVLHSVQWQENAPPPPDGTQTTLPQPEVSQ
jgi:HK97 family phage portal protein